MKKPEKKTHQDVSERRRFLQGAAVASAAAGSGLAANALADETATETVKKEKLGYHETEHVREYYRLARF